MPSRLPRFLMAAAALLAAPSHAAVDSAPGVCPVDGAEVRIAVLLSTNALLGHDRDLCPHAVGDDEIRSSISGCGTCGFAGTGKEFQKKLPEHVADRVKKELAPVETPWERWANRARILEWNGAEPQVIAESWLRAAWSVRLHERPMSGPLGDLVRSTVGGIPEPERETDQILDTARALDAWLAGKSATQADRRAAASYASGSFWRARGENTAAEERYAKALASAAGTVIEAAVRDAVERDRASIALEQTYLEKALAHFRAALAAGEKVPKHQRVMVAFLAAECARRTGSREEAQRLFKIAGSLGEPPIPGIKPLIEQGLAETAHRKASK